MNALFRAMLAGLLLAAFAQAGHAQAASDAEKKPLIERILKAQMGPEFEGLLGAMANSTSGPLVQYLGPRLQQVPEAKRNAARDELNQALNAHVTEVDKLLVARAPAVLASTLTPLYMQRFSTDELKQLVAIFESPVLKKYQDVAPEFRQKLVQGIEQDSDKAVGERGKAFIDKANAILAKYGVKPEAAPAKAAKPAAPVPAAKPAASAPAKK